MDGATTITQTMNATGTVVEPASCRLGDNDNTEVQAVRPSPPLEADPIFVRMPVRPDAEALTENRCIAPPPDTVVVGSWRQAIDAEEQTRARETILREEHAAEVTRLKHEIQNIKKVHAAEIEWMRTEHGAELLRLVEALWHAQDVAQDALNGIEGRPQSAVSASKARSWLDRLGAYEWRASLARRVEAPRGLGGDQPSRSVRPGRATRHDADPREVRLLKSFEPSRPTAAMLALADGSHLQGAVSNEKAL
jgi:hypothetical protein